MDRDSSGTEDDLPNHVRIRNSRVVISESTRIPSGPASRENDLIDMNFQIHRLETEAYGAVMRAFCAQSESLTWGKETLMSDLRKELRLSDDEHREILGKINSDESIKALREWRASVDVPKSTATNPAGFDPASMGHMPRKKLKTGHTSVLPSLRYPQSTQPSPASASAVNVRNDQWKNNAVSFAPQMNVKQALLPVQQNRQATSIGKVRAVQTSNRGFLHSGFENMQPDIIKILHTEKLLYEVEKACGAQNPDPDQVEKAKLMLRDHERSLTEAIAKLAAITDGADGDESPDQRWHQHSSVEQERNAQGFRVSAHKKLDRSRCHYTGYVKDHPGTLIPVIDLPDEEYD